MAAIDDQYAQELAYIAGSGASYQAKQQAASLLKQRYQSLAGQSGANQSFPGYVVDPTSVTQGPRGTNLRSDILSTEEKSAKDAQVRANAVKAEAHLRKGFSDQADIASSNFLIPYRTGGGTTQFQDQTSSPKLDTAGNRVIGADGIPVLSTKMSEGTRQTTPGISYRPAKTADILSASDPFQSYTGPSPVVDDAGVPIVENRVVDRLQNFQTPKPAMYFGQGLPPVASDPLQYLKIVNLARQAQGQPPVDERAIAAQMSIAQPEGFSPEIIGDPRFLSARSEKKTLDRDTALQFFHQAGRDVEKARKLAEDAGYLSP